MRYGDVSFVLLYDLVAASCIQIPIEIELINEAPKNKTKKGKDAKELSADEKLAQEEHEKREKAAKEKKGKAKKAAWNPHN